jgi:hypothetical protein
VLDLPRRGTRSPPDRRARPPKTAQKGTAQRLFRDPGADVPGPGLDPVLGCFRDLLVGTHKRAKSAALHQGKRELNQGGATPLVCAPPLGL